MTESTSPEDMIEPTTCEECEETFDAEHPDNWNSVPFYVQCPHCRTRRYPERDNYND